MDEVGGNEKMFVITMEQNGTGISLDEWHFVGACLPVLWMLWLGYLIR